MEPFNLHRKYKRKLVLDTVDLHVSKRYISERMAEELEVLNLYSDKTSNRYDLESNELHVFHSLFI